jgi:hypothetical protein
MSNILSSHSGVLNPVDYGAKGNDSSDNTTEFQDCFNDAYTQRKVVFIPRGVYQISGTVDAKAPFFGISGFMDRESRTSSEWNTIIKNNSINNGSAMFRIDTAAFSDLAPGMWIKDIKFDGNNLNTIGIQGRDDIWSDAGVLHNYYLYRVYAEQCSIGLDFYGFLGFFKDCYCKRNTQIGLRMSRNNAGVVTGGEYSGMQQGQANYGVEPLPWSMIINASGPGSTQGAGVISLNGTTIEAGTRNNGLQISEGWNRVSLHSVYMEGYEGGPSTESYIMDIASTDREGNYPGAGTLEEATSNVIFDNVKYGNGAGGIQYPNEYTSPDPKVATLGGKIRYGNILNIENRTGDSAPRQTIITDKCRFSSLSPIGGSVSVWGTYNTHFGNLHNVVDQSNQLGTEGTNYILNPNFRGGIRGFQSAVHGGLLTSEENTTVTRDGISSLKITAPVGTSKNNVILIYPHGQEYLEKGGLFIWKCWYYVPNLPDYAAGVAYPIIKNRYNSPTPITSRSSGYTGYNSVLGTTYTVGEWNLAHTFMEIPAGATNIGIQMQPWYPEPDKAISEEHYIYISDLTMVHNPGTTDKFFKGEYTTSPHIGTKIGTAIHIHDSGVPTDPDVSWLVGDIVWNTVPTTHIGWVCTGSGAPGTWSTFGNIT